MSGSGGWPGSCRNDRCSTLSEGAALGAPPPDSEPPQPESVRVATTPTATTVFNRFIIERLLRERGQNWRVRQMRKGFRYWCEGRRSEGTPSRPVRRRGGL